MHIAKTASTAAAIAALLLASPAFGMVTDDPGTVAPKSVQIELTADYAKSAEGKETLAGLALKTGILESLEIGVNAPIVISDPDAGEKESGIGDVQAGLKYRFLEAAGARPALALTAGLTIPTGDKDKGLGSGKSDFSAALVGGFDLKPVSFFFNLGYGRLNSADKDAGEKQDILSASAAAVWAVTEPLALNVEILYQSKGAEGEDDSWQSVVGAKYSFSEAVTLDAGARVGFTDAAPDWGLLAKLTLVFGGGK